MFQAILHYFSGPCNHSLLHQDKWFVTKFACYLTLIIFTSRASHIFLNITSVRSKAWSLSFFFSSTKPSYCLLSYDVCPLTILTLICYNFLFDYHSSLIKYQLYGGNIKLILIASESPLPGAVPWQIRHPPKHLSIKSDTVLKLRLWKKRNVGKPNQSLISQLHLTKTAYITEEKIDMNVRNWLCGIYNTMCLLGI